MAKNLILWLIIATVLLTVFKQLDTPVSNQEIAYSQFIQLVQSGQVKKVTISGATIDGEFSNGQVFETIRPGHDPKMMDDLLEHKVEVQGKKARAAKYLESAISCLVPYIGNYRSIYVFHAPNARWRRRWSWPDGVW